MVGTLSGSQTVGRVSLDLGVRVSESASFWVKVLLPDFAGSRLRLSFQSPSLKTKATMS